MAYFDFLIGQWLLGNLSEAQVDAAVSKGFITAEEAQTIKNTPKSV